MSYYSDNVIEEVLSHNDVVDVISSYVSLKKKGGTYFGLCPFHNERTPSFSVTPAKQMFYCFGCGAGGSVLTFLMKYENYSFPEAVERLAERAGIALPKEELSQAAKREVDLKAKILEMNKVAANYFYIQLRRSSGELARAYLSKRTLTEETIKKFGLGYASAYSNDLYQYLKQQGYEDALLKESGLISWHEGRGAGDKFWNRVMFPILDANHKVVGFGGRIMGEGEPKYLNSPETKVFEKSRTLYGLNFAKSTRRDYLLLCEGYLDVIALHQAGFDNAVASLGTAFTSGHANLLKRYTKEVYLSFDSDGAGVKAAIRAIPLLKEAGFLVKVITMTPYKDPDELIQALGNEAYQERINDAIGSFFFEISVLEKDYQLSDPESKTAFFNEIARKLLAFDEAIERENYMEAIAGKYRIGLAALRTLVEHMGRKGEFVRERVPLKSGRAEQKKKEDGQKLSQKMLLTWLIEDVSLFEEIKAYLGAEDFTEPIYQEVAKLLFAQHERGGVNPAKIISSFLDEEAQREAASLFHAKTPKEEEHRTKAWQETVYRVKENSILHRQKSLEPTDLVSLQKLVADKRQLEALRHRV
ncbi:DNA primase [Clostridia bacterium]|nr:DNA primase [Clostridia bacterium]